MDSCSAKNIFHTLDALRELKIKIQARLEEQQKKLQCHKASLSAVIRKAEYKPASNIKD
ncbi:hypothetical protein NQZ68_035549 [Dissostichus eleginoides]|nr:hypothetical protein NQZ68_035549 [Dissostichus eleginoides]